MKDADYHGLEKKECPCIDVFSEEVIVDVRTPKEFSEAHVKNAVNIPLMSNYQRHIIGKTYTQDSQTAAIEKGWDMFEPIVDEFVKSFDKFKDQKVIIYCWRGGMRSRLVVNLLRIKGIDAVQFTGGYKKYINLIWEGLEEFEKNYDPKFIVLFGNTGTRKTEILRELEKKGLPVLDLEGLAQHRSSVFGAVDLKPRSQKMFSILLYHKLEELKNEKYIFVEGESNKIGNVFLPKFVSYKIENDIKVSVKADIKTRVKATVKEYISKNPSLDEIRRATKSIAQKIGNKNVEQLLNWLDSQDYDKFAEFLLINYYDERYIHNKMGYTYDFEVNSDDVSGCVDKLCGYFENLSKI